MTEKELQELEDPNTWDLENAEIMPPVRNPRAVVSVSFPRGDFELVSECAEKHGMKTSEFIRKAAIKEASERSTASITVAGAAVGMLLVTSGLAEATQGAPMDAEYAASLGELNPGA